MTSVAVASKAGMKSGQMNPPSGDAAKSTPSVEATSMRCGADSFVHMISAPALRDALGLRVTDTGSAMRAPAFASAHQGQEREQRPVGVEGVAFVVDDGGGLAVGVHDDAELAAGRPDELGQPRPAGNDQPVDPDRRRLAAQDVRGDEVLARRVRLDDGADQVLRDVAVVRLQLLGVLRQAVAAVPEARVVVVLADPRVEADALDDLGACRGRASRRRCRAR